MEQLRRGHGVFYRVPCCGAGLPGFEPTSDIQMFISSVSSKERNGASYEKFNYLKKKKSSHEIYLKQNKKHIISLSYGNQGSGGKYQMSNLTSTLGFLHKSTEGRSIWIS